MVCGPYPGISNLRSIGSCGKHVAAGAVADFALYGVCVCLCLCPFPCLCLSCKQKAALRAAAKKTRNAAMNPLAKVKACRKRWYRPKMTRPEVEEAIGNSNSIAGTVAPTR